MDISEKKVLTLSCGTGGGYNTAAKAVQERLIEKGITADFKEYLEIINIRIKNTVNNLYLKSTNLKELTRRKMMSRLECQETKKMNYFT